jgi:serine/threonine protein phosphatase 1
MVAITDLLRLFILDLTMFLYDQPTVIHHPANTSGRDFIVGDLHGCRDMLETLLSCVRFDAKSDRLFSVGDLVDRGPDSEGCLNLLEEPWFFPVLGNHDAMLMAWILGDSRDRRAHKYEYAFKHEGGLEWAGQFSRASTFLPLLQSLPFVRVVGSGGSRFQVVHAELVSAEERGVPSGFDDDCLTTVHNPLWDAEHFIASFGGVGDWRDHALWGRSVFSRARQSRLLLSERHPNLSSTYVGHTIVPPVFGPDRNQPLQVSSHMFLDGGAFHSANPGETYDNDYGLVLWCHAENRGWMFNGENVRKLRGCPLSTTPDYR